MHCWKITLPLFHTSQVIFFFLFFFVYASSSIQQGHPRIRAGGDFSSHYTGLSSVGHPPASLQGWLSCSASLPSARCLGYALDAELALHSAAPAAPFSSHWVLENSIICVCIHSYTHIKQSSREFASWEEASIDFFKLWVTPDFWRRSCV